MVSRKDVREGTVRGEKLHDGGDQLPGGSIVGPSQDNNTGRHSSCHAPPDAVPQPQRLVPVSPKITRSPSLQRSSRASEHARPVFSLSSPLSLSQIRPRPSPTNAPLSSKNRPPSVPLFVKRTPIRGITMSQSSSISTCSALLPISVR